MVKLSIVKYLQKVMDELPEELNGKYAMTEEDHLFQVKV